MDLSHKRILVIKQSSLGDVIHALPLVHAIKRHYPSSYVGWVIQKNLKSLLEADPTVDEIITVDIPSTSEPYATRATYFLALIETFRTLKNLRKNFVQGPYDVVLDLHASFRSGLFGSMNRSCFRVGFSDAKELNTWFQTKLVQTPPEKSHAVDKILNFADLFDIKVEKSDFKLFIGNEAVKEAKTFMDDNLIGPFDRIVYANPASRWATKFWNTRAWADLSDRLISQLSVRVIFGGGESDRSYISEIASSMQNSPIIAAGCLSPIGSAALIKASDIYVGVDSGPMHISSFVGTPVVALFGPTDPAKVGPYGSENFVIRVEELDCLGCRKSECSVRVCMDGISADRVFDEILRITQWN
ncbi:MAG: glycosyltransferase family 9 protein [Pseudomonadota bacterium]